MDQWPSHGTDQPQVSAKFKGKGKYTGRSTAWTYPVVEPGSLSAANLCGTKERLGWTFLTDESQRRKLAPVSSPIQVFPETLKRPFRHDMPVPERADQGVQFLRTYYPDFEMSAELVRDEITADTHAMQAVQSFDPHIGDMIDTFTCPRSSGRSLTCLAFPMGDSYFDLNISPFQHSQRTNIQLHALANPIRSFRTPIQQIKASVSPVAKNEKQTREKTLLGVRTIGLTTLLDVQETASEMQISPVEISELIHVVSSDVGEKSITDMLLPATDQTLAVFVNDAGTVYRCTAPQGMKTFEHLHTTSDVSDDKVWRLAPSGDDDGCLLMSGQSALRLDFRARASVAELYNPQPGILLTSIEGIQTDWLVGLSTTEEVLWIDERNTKKPLLGVKHFRDFDRSLQIHTQIIANTSLTFLTSRRNALVLVYDVSYRNGMIRMNAPAHCLPPIRVPDGPNLGHVIFPHPIHTPAGNTTVFQLNDLGGVHMMQLALHSGMEALSENDQGHRSWSEEVDALDERVGSSSVDFGPLGARLLSEANLQPAYQRLFMNSQPKQNADAVYDLLEKMPLFWQEVEAPVEHTLTSYDIAYRSGPEPISASRNDIFTESVLNSKRGYRALRKGRIPIRQLAQRAPWHFSIAPFIRRFVSDLQDEPSMTLHSLHRYNLSSDERPSKSMQREAEAHEQVTLDLHLSADIFAPSRIRKQAESDLDVAMETMSRATEAMSLSDTEPPDVKFGFLHPLSRKEPADHYANSAHAILDSGSKYLSPLGVRLLLKEWDVGIDPSTYNYDDPYDDPSDHRHFLPRRFKEPSSRLTRNREQVTQSQQPPLVVPTSVPVPPTVVASQTLGSRIGIPATQSQNVRSNGEFDGPMDGWDFAPSSQLEMASTQVLPGPHGGRPGPLKKKPVKKRLGGF